MKQILIISGIITAIPFLLMLLTWIKYDVIPGYRRWREKRKKEKDPYYFIKFINKDKN